MRKWVIAAAALVVAGDPGGICGITGRGEAEVGAGSER